MQIKMPSSLGMTEPRFDEQYLAEAFAVLDTIPSGSKFQSGARDRANSHSCTTSSIDDLEQHARNITRFKCLDHCEDTLADLPTNVAVYLLGVFDQITDSFLPAPLWQAPAPPSKKAKEVAADATIIIKSLRIVSAARLALASSTVRDQQMRAKVEKMYQAATRYLDSVPQYDNPADIEAILLLAELEYGRNQNDAARSRLKNVISALTESSRMRSTLIFGQSVTLVRRRNALRTALMMLHWYFNEVPAPLEDLSVDFDPEHGDGPASAEEMFVTSQLRLASIHHRLKRFLDAQPYVDEKTWHVCEKAFDFWYDALREQSRDMTDLSEDAPVNFFVFHQQYLTTRILLSKAHERLYKRRSGIRSPTAARTETWTCPTSARNDAIRIASSLRNYGQRHRFREAPLSFVNHISAAADIVLNATEASENEDDRNAYLHISSFLCGVLKYMAEVHVRANTLVEAVQQRMNTVIQNGLNRSNSNASTTRGAGAGGTASSTYSGDSHLWQWTRYDLADDFGPPSVSAEPDRPKSVIGVLQTRASPSKVQISNLGPQRPTIVRQISTPAKLAVHPEVSTEDLGTVTPSFYSTKDNLSSLSVDGGTATPRM